MTKTYLLQSINRTEPDTFPPGKPPYFFDVKAFGIRGTFGVQDSNGIASYIGFSPNITNDDSWNRLKGILEDTFGKASETIRSSSSPNSIRYHWDKGSFFYDLSRGSKRIWFNGMIKQPSEYDSNGLIKPKTPSLPPPPQ